MSHDARPPLPSRQTANVPELPSRLTNASTSTVASSKSQHDASRPPLPSRPTHLNDASLTPGEFDSTQTLTPQGAEQKPPLPQRPEQMSILDASAPSGPHTSQPNTSTISVPSLPPRESGAFGKLKQNDAPNTQTPQPALPPRNSTIGTPSGAKPALPPRISVASSIAPTNDQASSLPPPALPSRKSAAVADPVTQHSTEPPPLPPSMNVQDTGSRQSNVAMLTSQVEQRQKSTSAQTSHSHHLSAHPTTLPQRQASKSTSYGSHSTIVSSGRPQTGTHIPSSPNTTPLPHHQPAPTISATHNQPTSNNNSSHGPAPALPRSVSPALPPRNGPPNTGNLDAKTNQYHQPQHYRASTSAPPINRATQPGFSSSSSSSTPHNEATHHTAIVTPAQNGGGMYLSGAHSSYPPSALPKVPLIVTESGPPPPLPPANASSSSSSPIHKPSSSSSPNGPPPQLPPSRPNSSIRPTAAPPPQLTVTPSSPKNRSRSKSFDATSGLPPPSLPPRSTSPAASQTLRPKSTRTSHDSSLAVPDTSDAAKEKQKGGRKRSNSEEGFKEIVRNLTSDSVAEGQYSVLVLTPQKQAKILGESDYVMMYPIEVKKGPQSWTIFRRFNQFYALDNDFKKHSLLKKSGFTARVPPKNSTLSKKDPLLLESRRRGFQQYLSEVCNTPMLAESDTFYMFIQPLQIGDIKPK